MGNLNFKELLEFGKELQVLNYKKVYNANQLPDNQKKEIVFIGKSNVGKSSLINILLNYKINKVSKNPGCTKWIGFLELPNINIIDLPGYGYSKVSQGRREFWDSMLDGYIKKNRASIVFILVDSRRNICEEDKTIMEMFKGLKTEIIYTKQDKKPENNGFFVSVKTGLGILELRKKILYF
ncbi:ribosome biogenesis GTP-binding protein YihA/YsxC [Alphaproteobacteria bacterium endosymbiont of Tiliacea citrago]|uniref:ribosome biogenesis GTP-binding protein YihA/YsxC n=1 Tax=Alphaproteobacteria bacterium endosymbiont of Tiliacea citrago TaxID=3077944 RepID=UPI00313D6D74